MPPKQFKPTAIDCPRDGLASLWAILPVSPLEEGKSRLSEALTPSERYLLNRSFFRRTLETVSSAIDRSRIAVVSRSGALLDVARQLGCQTVLEAPPHGLNRALSQAAEFARDRGAGGVLSVSCDLPFLIADELSALVDAAQRGGGLAIASDRQGSGTNALLISPVGRIPYRYGLGSFEAHCWAAAAAGAAMTIVRRAGLSFDIDTPDDFEQMEEIMRETLPTRPAAFAGGLQSPRLAGAINDAA